MRRCPSRFSVPSCTSDSAHARRPNLGRGLTRPDTLLEQTRRRVSRIVPEQQALLVLTRTHERYYVDHLRGVPPGNLLVQPYNHGTAPAIAYSLTCLNARAPEAVVGFFPSDHHVENDEAFAASVDQAFRPL